MSIFRLLVSAESACCLKRLRDQEWEREEVARVAATHCRPDLYLGGFVRIVGNGGVGVVVGAIVGRRWPNTPDSALDRIRVYCGDAATRVFAPEDLRAIEASLPPLAPAAPPASLPPGSEMVESAGELDRLGEAPRG